MDPGFEDDFSPLQGKGPEDADTNGEQPNNVDGNTSNTNGLKASSTNGGGCSPSTRMMAQEPREDPEVIKEWKKKQLQHLEEKDKNEEEARMALREKAKKELQEWYAQHSEQLAKLQSTNRAASESAEREIESTTQEIRPGTEWERVAKLCDFNPKSARNVKDISRLRSVILQLKQGGPCTSVMQQQQAS